ncbi:hypothetical protein FE257_009732 [Aspergillus nanangensis]|uniref:Macro domain-containing protein n=1 Tax=Aspergillus nanangensis TaxID=2582783 RepID=A0AAD4GRP6_ASPNN|nr:hypothetical protein FE257_009732 [Aspergillus nanangensis]
MDNALNSDRLSKVVQYLEKETQTTLSVKSRQCHCSHHSNPDWVLQLDTWGQLEVMQQLLCQRPPDPPLPPDILENIDAVLEYHNQHTLLTSSSKISPHVAIHNPSSLQSIRLSLWKGDITTLTDVTAIVNAANSELLGCFRPEHRCIDNVIHSAAGPGLRDACSRLMLGQGHPEPTGSVKVTSGFNLPSQWVLHTVGPQLNARQSPERIHREQLAQCYRSCLDASERLPPLPDGKKVVVFCCISTGLFAFPPDEAAGIAVSTVVEWCREQPSPSITDVIFDVFLPTDWDMYNQRLDALQTLEFSSSAENIPRSLYFPAITKARNWLEEADYLIITGGAGLSAAIGLDYTSPQLFQKHFPAFQKLGLRRLYDVFGFNGWDSLQQKWGYYFLHLDMVRNWPTSTLYTKLYALANRFESSRYFIRTSNADGQFLAHGFPANRISTPQGQYRFLQCYAKCRPDAVFPSAPFVDAALSFIDPETQSLTDESKVPRCDFCGGELTLCVRGGDYFNPAPFRQQERKWAQFRGELSNISHNNSLNGGTETATVVILELGVGLNTPAVLRWPNERLVGQSPTRRYRLIRAGMGASGCAPWELEEDDLAVGFSGDLNAVMELIID